MRCAGFVRGFLFMSKIVTQEEIISRFKKVHGDRYDYSLVEYENYKKKVKIICKIHNVFEQSPYKHYMGNNCPLCVGNKRLDLCDFIERSNKKHNNIYDYSFTIYKNMHTAVFIKCNIHGLFSKTPSSHLKGQGCPKCSNELKSINLINNPISFSITNWEKSALKSKNFDSFKVYMIRCWNEEEEFYKIGRTFMTTDRRFRQFPYNYEIIKELVFDNAKDAHNKETNLKRLNKQYKYVPKIFFDGMQECFTEITT